MKTYIIYDTTCPEEPHMSIPGHVHHVAPFISIYDPVTFADVYLTSMCLLYCSVRCVMLIQLMNRGCLVVYWIVE